MYSLSQNPIFGVGQTLSQISHFVPHLSHVFSVGQNRRNIKKTKNKKPCPKWDKTVGQKPANLLVPSHLSPPRGEVVGQRIGTKFETHPRPGNQISRNAMECRK